MEKRDHIRYENRHLRFVKTCKKTVRIPTNIGGFPKNSKHARTHPVRIPVSNHYQEVSEPCDAQCRPGMQVSFRHCYVHHSYSSSVFVLSTQVYKIQVQARPVPRTLPYFYDYYLIYFHNRKTIEWTHRNQLPLMSQSGSNHVGNSPGQARPIFICEDSIKFDDLPKKTWSECVKVWWPTQ